MGVPSFYRWVVERYPKCVVSAREDRFRFNGVRVPVNTTRPNPNGFEFDNLYLDMNGIIHPCFHPEGLPPPQTQEEVFEAVYKYIDRIFSVIRPRKLLFLAIDGVAPRAKMNQQRSRRFKAAKDAADNALGTESHRKAIDSGEESSKNQLDSNVITPGTEFMDLLSSALRYYIHLRMNDDLGWRGIKVILSDASVPGEGEHKIMSYIRLQRNMPGYDPNTRHCLYGLDADLIMLALATHEIHFSVLREDVHKSGLNKKVSKATKRLIRRKKRRKEKKMTLFASNIEDYITSQKFQFVNIWILREYLAYDMKIPSSTMEANLERLIDDFVFMCLFVGNDFLPHIPSLEISEGAINLLMRIYTTEFSERGGYLTNSFEVNLKHVEHFVRSIATHEHRILKNRNRIAKVRMICSQGLSDNKVADDSSKVPFVERNMESGNQESSLECKIAPVCQDPQNIELGWKERYYAEKFEAKHPDDRERVRRHVVTKYIEGICWVMRYYYEGVCSWQWFYPYHYAPFASDFCDINQLKFHFTLGEPFKPFDQLLGVLPAASAHALPLFYRSLMTDVSSPILDFYPTDFELDMNGKRFSWQAICKLPFIEESRLLSEIAKVEHTLTDEERRRNSLGVDILFLHISHPLAVEINSLFKQMNDSPEYIEGKVEQKIDPKFSGGMNGYIYISDKSMWPVEIPSPVQGMKMIAKNEVLFVFYKNPSFHSHIPRLLPGVILPEKSVSEKDILSLRVLWSTNSARMRLPIYGHKFSGRPITKLVSGSNLAKFAHALVAQNCLRKQPTLQSMQLDYHLGKLKEMKQEVGSKKRKRSKNKKRKRSEGDSVHVGADALMKMKTGEDKSGERNVNNIVGELESCIVRKQTEGRDDLTGVDGLKATKVEIETRKKKRKPKKRKRNKSDSEPNNTVEKLESCCLQEENKADEELNVKGDSSSNDIVEKLESSSFREQNQGVGDQASAHGLQEVKVEVVLRKRKRKPKKKKQNKSDSEPNDTVENLENCRLQEKSKADEELNIKGDSASNDMVDKLESSLFWEQNQGVGDQAIAHGLQEVKVEVGLRKRKRKPKKKKQNVSESAPNNIVEKLETSFVFKADNHNADQHKFEELKVKGHSVPHKIVGKLESHTPGEQSDNKGKHAVGGEGESTGINESGELKVEVEPKRKRRRSKKMKLSEVDDVAHNIVEKLESSSPGEQKQGNDQASADGLREIKVEVGSKSTDGLQEIQAEVGSKRQAKVGSKSADGLQEIQAEVGSKSADGLQEIQAEVGSKSADGLQETQAEVRSKSADGLQEIEAELGSKGEHAVGGEGESAGINRSGELQVEVEPKRKRRRSKKMKLREVDDVAHNGVEKLESSSPGEQKQGNDQSSADGLREIQAGVGSKGADGLQEIQAGVGSKGADGLQEIQAEVGSKSADGLQEIQAGVGSKGADGLQEIQAEVGSKSADGLQETQAEVRSKSADGLQEIEAELGSKGEHAVGGEGESAGINRSGELQVEVEPKRKRRRSKKMKLREVDDVAHNGVEKLESSSPGEQKQGNDQSSADGLREIQAGVGSKGADGLQEIQAGVGSKGADGLQEIQAGVGSKGADGLQEIQAGVGSKGADGLQEIQAEVGSKSADGLQEIQAGVGSKGADGLQEIQAEVGSRKKRQRCKKRKLNTTDAASIDIVDKMESSHAEKRDSNGEHTGAVELTEMKQSNLQESEMGIERKQTITDVP
ncbi:hypothetical protein ACOSQ3_014084 [Xanthoceras sorbifolium]